MVFTIKEKPAAGGHPKTMINNRIIFYNQNFKEMNLYPQRINNSVTIYCHFSTFSCFCFIAYGLLSLLSRLTALCVSIDRRSTIDVMSNHLCKENS